jgi:hypothetical protein
MPSLEQLLGPAGALVAVIFGVVGLARVVQVLWKDHLRADSEDRTERDRNYDGWITQTRANEKLADAWEQRNRDEAARRRLSDD